MAPPEESSNYANVIIHHNNGSNRPGESLFFQALMLSTFVNLYLIMAFPRHHQFRQLNAVIAVSDKYEPTQAKYIYLQI